ncbi:hypothetical protein EDD11_004535 [Mortierella claussenii]|nr:hypothetical protein EDD11_004535 [Mortierella claussenii]
MPSTTMTATSTEPAKRLFVFDFDWTLIDADSDDFVFSHLSKELHQEQLASVGKVQWTDLQQRLLGELFNRGVTKDDIERTLSQIPFAPEMVEALKLMKSQGSELYILSDANTVYIDTVLKANKIDHLFTRVITNPASFNSQGRLNVARFHGKDLPPHNCPLPCEPNLCKGQELQKLMDQQEWDQVVYMGDATNDFCPSTRLRSHDVVLARDGFLLQNWIQERRPELVKAHVVYWTNALEVLNATRVIFNASSIVTSTTATTADLETTIATAVTTTTMTTTTMKSVDNLFAAVESYSPRMQAQAVKA